MKIKYLEAARDDMMWFRTYYSSVFPAGKGNAREQLRRILQLISEHPEVGTPPNDFPEAFEHPISRTPFTMIYRVKNNELQILRVLDQRNEFSNDRKS